MYKQKGFYNTKFTIKCIDQEICMHLINMLPLFVTVDNQIIVKNITTNLKKNTD